MWNLPSDIQINQFNLFKDMFINNDQSLINEVFSENFGTHNGYTKKEYLEYEFNEFNEKQEKFINSNLCHINLYSLPNNLMYISIANKKNSAIFEAIFMWDIESNKIKGNQYSCIIEPKIQIIKKIDTSIQIKRKINFKSNNIINNIIPSIEAQDFDIIKNTLSKELGGSFTGFSYTINEDDCKSFIDKLKIHTDNGIYNEKIIMRGIDHPLFIKNQFPIIDNNTLIIPDHSSPVVLNIILSTGEEVYFKYPKMKNITFNDNIIYACITDNINHDWIQSNISN